jgi:GT2 family glycosyltransferase
MTAPSFTPTWVTQLELTDGSGALQAPVRVGVPYEKARVLVRNLSEPVGFLELALEDGGVSEPALRKALDAQLGVTTAPRTSMSTAPAQTRPTSVVLCTRDRPVGLQAALRSLLSCDHPDFEIVVVESAATSDAAHRVVRDLSDARVRVVTEPLPGLSRARNRGVRAARGELLAFTDDDVIADPHWLRALTRGFTRATHVGCVTGLVPAAELESEAQCYFDNKVTWSASCEPRLYDLQEHRDSGPLYPYTAGLFGAGANFALLRSTIEEVGLFDEALGAGTRAMGGEDLDYFLRTVLHGQAIAYEPAALVWHLHRRELTDLRRQMVGYGSGLSAFAFKQLTSRKTAWDVLGRVPAGLARMATLPAQGPSTPRSRQLRMAETQGLIAGPLRYLRGRHSVSKAA